MVAASRGFAWVVRNWQRGMLQCSPHCSLHSSTSPGPFCEFLGAFKRSLLLLSERIGARSRKHRGKEEKYFSWLRDLAYRCVI
ncbi:hypothetical protein SCHPADRAFT_760484 [Schizopora paradoxa]|uniref:Uncharacterized protein n=1 Tax=Schizopora paradoxa TaxID=27342 RepID=A0A0H2R3U5_9AGAM|nr:hypothetical protein SCHPADRAFT_760484 [Schizopora paradoxa]